MYIYGAKSMIYNVVNTIKHRYPSRRMKFSPEAAALTTVFKEKNFREKLFSHLVWNASLFN